MYELGAVNLVYTVSVLSKIYTSSGGDLGVVEVCQFKCLKMC